MSLIYTAMLWEWMNAGQLASEESPNTFPYEVLRKCT